MGSWFETCGLSGLPITPGDKALLFLLGPGGSLEDGRAGFCYPTGLWAPLCPPFSGKYNDDRGTLDLAKKAPAHWKHTKKILSGLKPVWRDERYAETKDWRPLPVEYDYEEFFSKIERGWVQGKTYPRHRFPDGTIPIGQVLVRKDVWDHLLESKFETWYGATSRETAHEDARTFVNYVIEHPPASVGEGLSWSFSIEQHFEETGGHSVLFWTIYHSGESGPNFARYRIAIMHGLIDKKVSPDEALAILYEIADVAHVNRMMSHLRRAWQPQPGKGSQDINWELHEGFTRKVSEIAAVEKKRYEDE